MTKPNILITGGTGFIGKALQEGLKGSITVLTRQKRPKNQCTHVHFTQELSGTYDIIINLAGARLSQKRWTRSFKKELEESRLHTTQNLIQFINQSPKKPKLLISASAVGFYGHDAQKVFTEKDTPSAQNFAQNLCAQWEQEALKAQALGVRTCILRFGVVLGKGDGFLATLRPLFNLGLGPVFGDGNHWLSWIHLHDVCTIIQWLITHSHQSGIFNATAPQAIPYHMFATKFAHYLKRPFWLHLPPWFARLVFGEMADELLLNGQHVTPARLIQEGYAFRYPTLDKALSNLI